MLDTITTVAIFGCFACVVLCEITQTYLSHLEQHLKWQWMVEHLHAEFGSAYVPMYEMLEDEWDKHISR